MEQLPQHTDEVTERTLYVSVGIVYQCFCLFSSMSVPVITKTPHRDEHIRKIPHFPQGLFELEQKLFRLTGGVMYCGTFREHS